MPIPREISAAWARSSEVVELLRKVGEIRAEVKAARDGSDKFYDRLDFDRVNSLLEGLKTELELIKPYAVCPSCNGISSQSSCFCKGKGYLSRFHWKVCTMTETKKITGRSGI